MKGVIMAGGFGSRLQPMTKVINKHLLPVYDKPMIYYPLSTLMLANIRDILIITTPEAIHNFQMLIGDGSSWGINIEYAQQAHPRGLAEAFIVGEKFIKNDPVCFILGDNLFQGSGLEEKLHAAKSHKNGASIFTYYVSNPSDYGVVVFDEQHKIINLEEKPKIPKSHYAVTGLYFYDNDVVEMAKSILPSHRNELEITDINKIYLAQKRLYSQHLGRGFMWYDMGTADHLLNAANFIELIETRQSFKINCPEEVAWRKGFITEEDLERLADANGNKAYAKYLKSLLIHEYV